MKIKIQTNFFCKSNHWSKRMLKIKEIVKKFDKNKENLREHNGEIWSYNTKVAEIKEQVQEEYKGKLEVEVAGVKKELVERVDGYLEYVADEWMKENKLAVEHGLKTEMTESFLME